MEEEEEKAPVATNNVFYSDLDKKLQSGTVILVSDPRRAGEGREAHIEYLVQIEGHSVRRRFSEFDSFREVLTKLNPTCIVPPLPEKEGITLSSVGLTLLTSGPTIDNDLVERRRIYLQSFLNRIAKHPILSASRIFHRFLEAENWGTVLVEESKNIETPSYFGSLSIVSSRIQRADARFLDIQNHNVKFGQQIGALERNCRRYVRRQNELAGDYAELGSIFQSFAATEKELSKAISKTGEAVDGVFLSTRYMIAETENSVLDPLQEYVGFVNSIKAVLKGQEQRHVAVESLMDQLQLKRDQLKAIDLQIAGQPAAAEPITAVSIFRKVGTVFSSMVDSNPQQTLRDNQAKLKTTVEQLETTTDAANSDLLKDSEAILHDFEWFNKAKAIDFKNIMTRFANIEIEFFQKSIALWESVLPVVEKTTASSSI